MSELAAFVKIVDRLKLLTVATNYDAPVIAARSKPEAAAREVERLRISKGDGWGGHSLTADEEKVAQRVFKQIAEERRKEGEAEKRRLLLEYAREIEALRDVLCQYAAKAAIEAGAFARALRDEATK